MNFPLIVLGKAWGEEFVGTIKSLGVKFEMPTGHAGGEVENSVHHMSLECRGEVRAEMSM